MKHVSGIVAALVCASTLVGCAPGTGPAESSEPRGIVTSGPETGDLLVHGRVLDGGEPVADADVWADVWPGQDVLGDLEEGEQVDQVTVGAVGTDAGGRFALRLDADDLPSSYVQDGIANYDLQVWHDGRWLSWSIPAQLLPSGVWRSHESARPADPTTSVTVDLGRRRIVTVDSAGDRQSDEVSLEDLPADVVPDRTE